jgi:pteridine reductase
MLTLAGKGALVVGSKRIGGAVVHRLASEGVNLTVAYRNSYKEAVALQKAVASQGSYLQLIQGDVSIEEEVQRILSSTIANLGELSFVINLASGFQRSPLDSLNSQAWDDALSAAKGSYLLAIHAARAMEHNSGPTRGHIVLFGDWAASETPYKHYLPYLTAKAAIQFMVGAFAVELAPLGILVNAIAPGPTIRPPEFPLKGWQQMVFQQTPLRRESSAQEMAEFIVTLLKSETITGETIRVDSGRHLAGPGLTR